MNQTAFFNPPCRPWLGVVLGLAVLATACDRGSGSGPASAPSSAAPAAQRFQRQQQRPSRSTTRAMPYAPRSPWKATATPSRCGISPTAPGSISGRAATGSGTWQASRPVRMGSSRKTEVGQSTYRRACRQGVAQALSGKRIWTRSAFIFNLCRCGSRRPLTGVSILNPPRSFP